MTKKILISFDEDLLVEVDEYRKKMYLDRSSAVRVLCAQALEARKGMEAIQGLVKAYQAEKLAQSAGVDAVGDAPIT